jgi:hypothetical protein
MDQPEIVDTHRNMPTGEQSQPLRQIWCSMCDPQLPKGSQFLGAVAIEARGIASALHELNSRGLNLGGEIMFVEMSPDKRIPDEWMYRVMDKDEALNCPFETT